MKAKSLLSIPVFLLLCLFAKAQFAENFSDGDITINPPWTGNVADWSVNASFQLQSNNSIANSTFYISTPSTLMGAVQWQMDINLAFNTSAANYVDVFLAASASDLTATTTTGYFVRIGSTADDICLYRKDGSAIIKIIDGADGVTNNSNNTIQLIVTKDAAGHWSLLRDLSGAGVNFLKEGNANDATYNTSAYFGILIKQSASSFFQRHFFDNIEVKAYIPDTKSPEIISATATGANAVDLLFNEPIDQTSLLPLTNFAGNNLLGIPSGVVLDPANSSLVHLTFANQFVIGFSYQLAVNNIKDLAGNAMQNGVTNFIYYAPYIASRYDVVIDEIMADPSPQVALPNNEWIEIRNNASLPVNLQGWRIGDINTQSGPMPNRILMPDSFVIVCSGSSLPAMSAFGSAIAVSGFPSLDNTADQLWIKSPENLTVHSVSYNDDWYQDDLKKNGGWSLEMIDTKNPCTGFSNWKAGADAKGGTPGKINSLNAVNTDRDAPALLRAYATDSLTLVLMFNEPLDSGKAGLVASYKISDGIGVPLNAIAIAPSFDKVQLKLSSALFRNKIYTIETTAITDCVGNEISNKNTAKTGLAEIAATSDIVINEVLFNPTSTGTDFVEIFNRSNKIIDLNQTFIVSRNSSGVIGGKSALSNEGSLMFPQDFLVITENIAKVKANYITQNPDAFAEVNMPSFNDDKGNVVILNAMDQVTDELAYNENWHFKLIENREGVSLERIDYNAPTQQQDNWHSAATSAGYATPTYKNSQYRINDGVKGAVKLSPEIFSPDNDGQDDFAMLDYEFPEAGYVANITIFDANGRKVRSLQRNALCGTKGSFRWDGFGEKNQPLSIGVYIAFTEVFNLKGNVKQFKQAIVLARR